MKFRNLRIVYRNVFSSLGSQNTSSKTKFWNSGITTCSMPSYFCFARFEPHVENHKTTGQKWSPGIQKQIENYNDNLAELKFWFSICFLIPVRDFHLNSFYWLFNDEVEFEFIKFINQNNSLKIAHISVIN